jgi:hypothetical protein
VGLPFVKRLPEPPDPDSPGPMRFAEPGKLAGEMLMAGFREVTEEALNLPAIWPGTPEVVLASLLELATPLRHAIEDFTQEQRDEATREVLDTLGPKFDGTHTHSIAPIIVVRGIK